MSWVDSSWSDIRLRGARPRSFLALGDCRASLSNAYYFFFLTVFVVVSSRWSLRTVAQAFVDVAVLSPHLPRSWTRCWMLRSAAHVYIPTPISRISYTIYGLTPILS